MCTQIQVFDSVLSESLLLLLYLDTFHNMVKLGFHYLFLLIFYHMIGIYIGLHLQNLIHVLSIVIQQKLWRHSLLCSTFHIYLSAHLCCNTHMSILVGSSCICNSSVHVNISFIENIINILWNTLNWQKRESPLVGFKPDVSRLPDECPNC